MGEPTVDKLAQIAEDSARGGFFLFTGNALSTVILAVGSILVARLLGQESYGLYSVILVAPSLFLLLTDFGINAAATRFSAKLRAEGKSRSLAGMLKSALLFKLLTGAAMSCLCIIFSNSFATYILNRPDAAPLIRLAGLIVFFQAVLFFTNSAFLGLDRTQDNALTMNLNSVVKAVSSPMLILLGFGVAGAIIGHLLGYVVAGTSGCLILYLKHYRSLGGASADDSSRSNLGMMVGYGFPLYVCGLLATLLGQYRTIILAHFTSNAAIGNLAVAMNLASLIGILIFPMAMLFPAFSKVDRGGGEARRLFRWSVKYTSLLVIPAALGVAVLSRGLVLLIYGGGFPLAPLLLSIYVLTFLYAGMGSLVLGYLLQGVGETRVVLKASLINLSVFVPLAPVLTWRYGVPGMIVAGLICGAFSLIYQLSVARRRLGVSFVVGDSLRIYLASAASAGITLMFLWLSPFQSLANLILGGSLFLFTYLNAAPLVGAVRPLDIQNIEFIFRRVKVVWPFLNPLLAYEARLAKWRRPE